MSSKYGYGDFVGNVVADTSDFIASQFGGDNAQSIGKFFKIDEERFEVIGVSISGVNQKRIALRCIDKLNSTENKKHIIDISIDANNKNFLEQLFKRIHIVLYDKYTQKYSNLDCDAEGSYEDFHKSESD